MDLKRTIKRALGAVCESPLLRPWVRRCARRSVNVVYYHYVGDPGPHYAAFYRGCTVARFADDLERLSRVFDFAPLSEVVAGPATDDRSSRPKMAITFDDGFDLRHGGVMDILEKHGAKATTFVITSCIGNQRMMWRHMLSAIQTLVPPNIWSREYNALAASIGSVPLAKGMSLLSAADHWEMHRKDEWAAALWHRCRMPPVEEYLAERRPYFDWDGLREWLSTGHSVGFHTHTHPYCSRLQGADLDRELSQPAMDLMQRLALGEMSLSYPFGDRLPPVVEEELFRKGIFAALFGIKGFRRRGATNRRLERAGVEDIGAGWAFLATIAPGQIRPGGQES